LIESSPAAAVDILVGSGFLASASDGGTAVARFEVGGVSMQIRSSNPRVGAFRAIDAFEQRLRTWIGTKLLAAVGPRWFKQRVDGAVQRKARDNRAKALADGETEESLIAYLDLGDLIAILPRKDNWDQVFGAVFPNRQWLEFDLQALVASRRPTMHARPVDGVRLVEVMCIISRLSQWIDGDGGWKLIADSED
jgi:hypothetical protein